MYHAASVAFFCFWQEVVWLTNKLPPWVGYLKKKIIQKDKVPVWKNLKHCPLIIHHI